MESRPHWSYLSMSGLLCSLWHQVTQRAEPNNISINKFSMLQGPAAATLFFARTHPVSLMKPGRKFRALKWQMAEH